MTSSVKRPQDLFALSSLLGKTVVKYESVDLRFTTGLARFIYAILFSYLSTTILHSVRIKSKKMRSHTKS